MRAAIQSSRRRFAEYRRALTEKKNSDTGLPPGVTSPTAIAHPGIGSSPGVGHKRQRSFWVLFGEFAVFLNGHRLILALMLTSVSLAVGLGLIPMYGFKLVFDNALGAKPLDPWVAQWNILPTDRRQLLTTVAVTSVTIAAMSIVMSIWARWHATRITKRIQVTVRRRVFEHAVRLPLHRVYALKSGGAASLLREDAGGVGELLFAMIYNPWRAIIQLIGCLVILAFTDWRLLAGSLMLLPAVYLTHKTWIGRIRPVFQAIRATRTITDGHATETFGGMRVVRSFSRQRSEASQYTRHNDFMARQEILAWWWSRTIDIAWALIIPAASAALLWYGGNRVITDAQLVQDGLLAADKALTVGDLVMFLAYVTMLLGPIETLAGSATQFQNSLAGLDRVLNLLAEPTEMPSKPGARVIDRADAVGRIELRQVTYTYPAASTPALIGVSLTVEPGQMIALVGPSGSGKTTLCNLVARFFDPAEGQVLFDGTDLRDIDVDSYRSLLGVVEQDTFLFDGTIADNLSYGRRNATMEQIIDAARQANAHEFISALPKGYSSQIGERGVRLSGGQRQRLTIARAILADPRILILDEATSNLDSESERLIQASLHALMKGRTTFVIAHRLSTIAHADKIIVVDKSRVIEEGRHEDLMQRSGRYRQMVELQTAPPIPPRTPGTPVEPAIPVAAPVATV